MSAYPGRDGFVGAPSGVVWQTNADGVTEGIDTAGAADGDVATWNPDKFGTGLGGWERRRGLPATPQEGDMLVFRDGAWTLLAIGIPGQALFVSPDSYPAWGTLSGGVIVRNLLRSPDGSALLSPDGSSLITST